MKDIFLNEGISESDLLALEPQWVQLTKIIDVQDTFGGIDSVSRIWWNGIQSTIDITFEDGTTYSFTHNHKLLVRESGEDFWVMCKDLTENMEIVDIYMERSNSIYV
jgi:intein/homing endonuclease